MLRASAGFVRFKAPPVDPATGRPVVVFQCGISTPTVPAVPGFMGSNFTAFQCGEDRDGNLLYDTVVYISNRNPDPIRVDVRITNAENGEVIVNTFVTIDPWKMLAYSLAGALR